jgi:hypothetical protein
MYIVTEIKIDAMDVIYIFFRSYFRIYFLYVGKKFVKIS